MLRLLAFLQRLLWVSMGGGKGLIELCAHAVPLLALVRQEATRSVILHSAPCLMLLLLVHPPLLPLPLGVEVLLQVLLARQRRAFDLLAAATAAAAARRALALLSPRRSGSPPSATLLLVVVAAVVLFLFRHPPLARCRLAGRSATTATRPALRLLLLLVGRQAGGHVELVLAELAALELLEQLVLGVELVQLVPRDELAPLGRREPAARLAVRRRVLLGRVLLLLASLLLLLLLLLLLQLLLLALLEHLRTRRRRRRGAPPRSPRVRIQQAETKCDATSPRTFCRCFSLCLSLKGTVSGSTWLGVKPSHVAMPSARLPLAVRTSARLTSGMCGRRSSANAVARGPMGKSCGRTGEQARVAISQAGQDQVQQGAQRRQGQWALTCTLKMNRQWCSL